MEKHFKNGGRTIMNKHLNQKTMDKLTPEYLWDQHSRLIPATHSECAPHDDIVVMLKDDFDICMEQYAAQQVKEAHKYGANVAQRWSNKFAKQRCRAEQAESQLAEVTRQRDEANTQLQSFHEFFLSVYQQGCLLRSDLQFINEVIAAQNALGGSGCNIYAQLVSSEFVSDLSKMTIERDRLREELKEVARHRDEAVKLLGGKREYYKDFFRQLENENKDELPR